MQQPILYHVLEEISLTNGKLYRLKKGTLLRLVNHSRLSYKHVRIFCNLPSKPDASFKFVRSKFYEHEWIKCENQHRNDDFDKYVEIQLSIAGSFQFYFVIGSDSGIQNAIGGADMIVEPELRFSKGQSVDLNCLQMQTVLPKLLGSLDEWESRLRITKESGYNMIHFTPVEELSQESNSSYSLRDHRKLNAIASSNGKFTFYDLEKLLNKMYMEWDMFSICDLVYNHMSNDAPFLTECHDAGYNLVNSKFMRPAFLFDRLLHYLGKDIENGVYEAIGIKSQKLEFDNLEQISDLLKHHLIPRVKFEEFYCIHVDRVLNAIQEKVFKGFKFDKTCESEFSLIDLWARLTIIQDPDYARLQSTVDFDVVRKIVAKEHELLDSGADNAEHIIMQKLRSHLEFLNNVKKAQVESWLHSGVQNVYLNARYHFFADDGPKYKRVTKKTPLITLYFYYPFEDSTIELDEVEAYDPTSKKAKLIMAHNGWVMNHDPLANFATAESLVYLKRELIAWGDSVKLRYGSKPEDSPGLWKYMEDYTRNIARMCHGVRLDNCHNTPLHVAQHFLDVARDVRPDLYVIAELFTNSAGTDNIFVSKLGITSLIRESMNAWNARELSRLLHRFGGDPVGSFKHPIERPLRDSVAHAVFFDITHDNKSLIGNHTVYDALSRSALLLMCGCAYGSTRGFDELVPHEIHVVEEKRPYARWSSDKCKPLSGGETFVNADSGFIKAKARLNKLHFELASGGYTEIYVDLLDEEVIAMTRSNPDTHQSIVLISRTAFGHTNAPSTVKEFRVPLKLKSILFEAALIELKPQSEQKFEKSETHINAIENYELKYQENVQDANKSFFLSSVSTEGETVFHFKDLPPGSVIAFSFGVKDDLLEPITKLRSNIQLSNSSNELYAILDRLTFDELNVLLFRVSEEEVDEEKFSNVYVVPNFGPLIFCGLQGFMNVLEKVRLNNDLGHPMFENLRQGNWMMEYIVNRLKLSCQNHPHRNALLGLANWLDVQFNLLYKVPRYMIPAYFDVIMTSLYTKILDQCFKIMSNRAGNNALSPGFILNGSSFIHSLALTSIQLVGVSKSARLPDTLLNGPSNDYLLSIAAGLPFFSHGIMRNWGRDTFIALKGLLLLTNRHEDAKQLILTYGSCLRHGLIPNLLGEGICARYNARDAVWWWLKGIKDYTECITDGYKILDEEVYRLYPTDDAPYPSDIKNNAPKQKLSFIIQECLTVHVNGLNFIERNAGPQIDDHMREEGFHNSIHVDLETGFVYGGNRYNCGTWMDKNGSSTKAGNNGVPATPRDGSAVELVGLSRCILEWLIKMNNAGRYPYDGVNLNAQHKESTKLEKYTWVEWAARLDRNFEKHFWISSTASDSPLINKREIYKDTLNSAVSWADYQLRPNFLIALCLAPQMVSLVNARKALAQCKLTLLNSANSLGIKTLDPSDYTYNGVYDNSNDSDNPQIANGYNYHNGPEWLWPMGYYLKCVMQYAQPDEHDTTVKYVQRYLAKYNEAIRNSDWKSLPELTNENGEDCIYSCPSQAWSIASLLEACYDLTSF